MDVPLWKQELLKRKQAKLGHEKLVSTQNSNEFNSKARPSNAVNNAKVLNRRLNDSETKADFDLDKQNAFDKSNSNSVYNSKKGGIYERNIVISGGVDKSDTRQKSQNLKGTIVSGDIGPSRLDSFNERRNRNIENYNANSVSGSCNYRGVQENARGEFHRKSGEKSSKTIGNNDCDKDKTNESRIAQGVEREHISPRDVKKMWELQATKDETLPKGHVVKSPSSAKEISRGFHPSREDTPHRVNTQVISNPTPTSVPKAYKSPYAKKQWHRPASVNEEKSVKSHEAPSSAKKELTSPAKTPLTNGGIVKDNKRENGSDDGVEHIQSVKSLLGLFGGKAKPSINRKVSDTVLVGNKTKKEKDRHTLESKSQPSKRPGLFKHHSEPNLFFSTDNEIVKDVPTSPKKSPTTEPDKVVLPSHHVSQGIQARMTKLRTASHSNLEEMDSFVELQNRLNGEEKDVGDQRKNESQHITRLDQGPQQKDIVSQKDFTNAKVQSSQQKSSVQVIQQKFNSPKNHLLVGNNKQATMEKDSGQDIHTSSPVKTLVDNRIEENLFDSATSTTINNDNEKSRLSSNDKLSSPVSNVQNTFRNQNDSINNYTLNGMAVGPDLTDINEHKSKNKYQSKQSNYVVEDSQSDTGLQNHVVTTGCLTEINQNKQDAKPVIKSQEEAKEIIEKPNKKPRKRGLNIVDPSAVLELTKDPILLKEKPAAAELGVFKDSPTGKVEIIKHEPDKKDQIAKINRKWDRDDHLSPSKQNNGQSKMPAPSVQILHVPSKNIPVTSIDEIPVSVIDDFDSNKSTKVQPVSNIDTSAVKVDNTTFYNGTLSSASNEIDAESAESDEEFIPVSSIDSEVDLGPPPEIVFDEMPGNLKSSFAQRGKVSIFSFFGCIVLFPTYLNLFIESIGMLIHDIL